MRRAKASMMTLLFALAIATTSNAFNLVNVKDLVKKEADYIVKCQWTRTDWYAEAYGAINNVYPGQGPTYIWPRENGLAILGLLLAREYTGIVKYAECANWAADYLIKVQDSDGAWYNQYNGIEPGDGGTRRDTEERIFEKSPTSTAEVIIALHKLGYRHGRYGVIKKGASYLISCQKNGGDGYLIGGGKLWDGKSYHSWRWASDNSWAYQALKAVEMWAKAEGDTAFAEICSKAAARIITGMDKWLYIRGGDDYGVWRRVVDASYQPVVEEQKRDVDQFNQPGGAEQYRDWINYAPQMIDIPAEGVNRARVGDWIHSVLQQPDGSCILDDGKYKARKSPGSSFQAVLCWRDLNQNTYSYSALAWAMESGLWQRTPDDDGVVGGWVDWTESEKGAYGNKAPYWQRYIDTSFYAISAYNGGYDFRSIRSGAHRSR